MMQSKVEGKEMNMNIISILTDVRLRTDSYSVQDFSGIVFSPFPLWPIVWLIYVAQNMTLLFHNSVKSKPYYIIYIFLSYSFTVEIRSLMSIKGKCL